MAKKIAISFSVVFAVILAVIVFSLVGAAYSTDTAALLEEAKAYEAEGNYGQAEAIYRSIVADYPGTDEAFQAQKNLALILIVMRNYPAAQAEVDALIADFTGHQGLPQVIYDLANGWWYAAKFEESQKLFKYIVDNMPDSDLAIWAQGWVAGCDMKLGNYTAAQEQIDALITDFADNPQLTGVIYQLADEYWNAGRYEDSGRFYQYVLERDPNGELAVWAKGWITGFELILGDSVSAQQVIDVLVTDCAGQSQLVLGRILYGNANGCWYVGKYEQARELYKYIADNLPESNRFMRAKAWVAGADLMLGNYAAAQQAIDSLITDFNDHPDLPEAVSCIEEAYYIRILSAKQPLREDYLNAVKVWEKVTEKFPDFFYDDPDLYYFVADCYRQLGEYEKAIEYYGIVAAKWTQNGYAVLSNVAVPRAEGDDAAGDYEALHDTIDRLIADFGDHPGLACVVTRSGHGYRRRANDAQREGSSTEAEVDNLKAIALYDRVINEFASSGFVASSYFFSALCYRDLGQWQDAMDCCNRLLDSWPGYKYASWAGRLAQNCSERLAEQVQ